MQDMSKEIRKAYEEFNENIEWTTAYKNQNDASKDAFRAGYEAAIEMIINYHKGQPDHDAEILGFPDGEAPTGSSRAWKFANKER